MSEKDLVKELKAEIKIGEQNKQIADLEAKLDTKDKLLDEALQKIKGIHEDSTEKTEPEEIKTENEE